MSGLGDLTKLPNGVVTGLVQFNNPELNTELNTPNDLPRQAVNMAEMDIKMRRNGSSGRCNLVWVFTADTVLSGKLA